MYQNLWTKYLVPELHRMYLRQSDIRAFQISFLGFRWKTMVMTYASASLYFLTASSDIPLQLLQLALLLPNRSGLSGSELLPSSGRDG